MQASTGLKILVIDDETPVLKLLSQFLSRKGYAVEIARNGQEGIEKVKSGDYRVIMTDIKMPGMSGEEVLAEIRKIEGDDVPVLGMSGTPWLLENQPFDAVLEKPCSLKEIAGVIGKIAPLP